MDEALEPRPLLGDALAGALFPVPVPVPAGGASDVLLLALRARLASDLALITEYAGALLAACESTSYAGVPPVPLQWRAGLGDRLLTVGSLAAELFCAYSLAAHVAEARATTSRMSERAALLGTAAGAVTEAARLFQRHYDAASWPAFGTPPLSVVEVRARAHLLTGRAREAALIAAVGARDADADAGALVSAAQQLPAFYQAAVEAQGVPDALRQYAEERSWYWQALGAWWASQRALECDGHQLRWLRLAVHATETLAARQRAASDKFAQHVADLHAAAAARLERLATNRAVSNLLSGGDGSDKEEEDEDEDTPLPLAAAGLVPLPVPVLDFRARVRAAADAFRQRHTGNRQPAALVPAATTTAAASVSDLLGADCGLTSFAELTDREKRLAVRAAFVERQRWLLALADPALAHEEALVRDLLVKVCIPQ